MTLPQEPYTKDDVEIVQRDELYQSFFRAERLHLRHKLYAGGWSATITREIFLRGEAIGVVLFDPKHNLIGLVEQFRVGALEDPHGPWCMEVVAGMVEQGETLEEVARRETVEETSLTPDGMEYICNYIASPGGCDEKLHLFCSLIDLSEAGGVHGLDSESEDIKLHVIPAADVFDNLYSGRFNNAATLIALQWLQHNHRRLLDLKAR